MSAEIDSWKTSFPCTRAEAEAIDAGEIEIDAVLIMTPTPERMRLRTTINLDNGLARTEIRDA